MTNNMFEILITYFNSLIKSEDDREMFAIFSLLDDSRLEFNNRRT